MKIEYIVTCDKTSKFINNADKIKQLISLDDEIQSEDKISFVYDKVSFKIDVAIIQSKDQTKNYFNITLAIDNKVTDAVAQKITKLNRKLNIIFNDVFKHRPKILWNDLDSYYSTKAYPLIKDIENLMRKVLTKLLISNNGFSWEKENVPEQFRNKSSMNKGRDLEVNYLSGLDFIDLTVMIFQKYSHVNNDVLYQKIESTSDLQELEKIKELLPKSNWERYLSEHIGYEETQLIEDWKSLYRLRCAVAHNTGFSSSDYTEVESLINKIKPILEITLEKTESRVSPPVHEQSSSESDNVNSDNDEGKVIVQEEVNMSSGLEESLKTVNDDFGKVIFDLNKPIGKGVVNHYLKLKSDYYPVRSSTNWQDRFETDLFDNLIIKETHDLEPKNLELIIKLKNDYAKDMQLVNVKKDDKDAYPQNSDSKSNGCNEGLENHDRKNKHSNKK
ncbi:HEPN domain-containing protein [Citrobacter portucalensis]|uniref:HEPN domain-containing protein n=1 Tax=Citrobacter portucalensis TaxID=1639133 RepID=A0ABD5GY88_9ENTR|nr:HEPN domain-containing protein [Citrobacter portucalensis]MDW2633124.1 HEPN domain-containing protein [Citrobacter portucalensis]